MLSKLQVKICYYRGEVLFVRQHNMLLPFFFGDMSCYHVTPLPFYWSGYFIHTLSEWFMSVLDLGVLLPILVKTQAWFVLSCTSIIFLSFPYQWAAGYPQNICEDIPVVVYIFMHVIIIFFRGGMSCYRRTQPSCWVVSFLYAADEWPMSVPDLVLILPIPMKTACSWFDFVLSYTTLLYS